MTPKTLFMHLIKWAFDPPRQISGDPRGEPLGFLSIHTEFHPIWSSRRDAVASPDLEIIDGIYCIRNGSPGLRNSGYRNLKKMLF